MKRCFPVVVRFRICRARHLMLTTLLFLLTLGVASTMSHLVPRFMLFEEMVRERLREMFSKLRLYSSYALLLP